MRETAPGSGALASLVPLLGELNDLKRIRPAGTEGSLAEETFRRSWRSLIAGEEPGRVARRETAAALAAARLGGINRRVLVKAGLGEAEIFEVLERSFEAVAVPLPEDLRDDLHRALGDEAPSGESGGEVPFFVEALAQQPRAGATSPGRARLVVEPPEGHADHCAVVAIYGVLLSGFYEADPAEPFLAGLAHHLHNAVLPDAGFAGEELLGDKLAPVFEHLTTETLKELPEGPAGRVRGALGLVGQAESPEARAFNAADVVDRVLQMRHHARAAAFTLDEALDDMDLVHEGPLKSFHEEVLQRAALR